MMRVGRLFALVLTLAAPVPLLAQGQPMTGNVVAPTGTGPSWTAGRAQVQRWSPEQAHDWYRRQPWIVGANFVPSTAINQLEMFQAETWDPATIDRELGWAASIGMNTVRVYLHDLLWQQDSRGFTRRIDQFLDIAKKHGIRPTLVIFDSVWDPDPELGAQRRPLPGVHNSGWVQSPGRRTLVDRSQHKRLLDYVRGVVGAFKNDNRVLMWDVWNEPDNPGGGSYNPLQLADEQKMIEQLLPQVFATARAAGAKQPLTSGVWIGDDWSPTSTSLNEIQKIQLEQSDVTTFHDYSWPETFVKRANQLKGYGRPLICTEWMARGNGSIVDMILPIAKRENIGMINWGLVDGDSQTRLPWDSWERPYVAHDPWVWFHDLFRADGTPYREPELQIFRELTGRGTPATAR